MRKQIIGNILEWFTWSKCLNFNSTHEYLSSPHLGEVDKSTPVHNTVPLRRNPLGEPFY